MGIGAVRFAGGHHGRVVGYKRAGPACGVLDLCKRQPVPAIRGRLQFIVEHPVDTLPQTDVLDRYPGEPTVTVSWKGNELVFRPVMPTE